MPFLKARSVHCVKTFIYDRQDHANCVGPDNY